MDLLYFTSKLVRSRGRRRCLQGVQATSAAFWLTVIPLNSENSNAGSLKTRPILLKTEGDRRAWPHSPFPSVSRTAIPAPPSDILSKKTCAFLSASLPRPASFCCFRLCGPTLVRISIYSIESKSECQIFRMKVYQHAFLIEQTLDKATTCSNSLN